MDKNHAFLVNTGYQRVRALLDSLTDPQHTKPSVAIGILELTRQYVDVKQGDISIGELEVMSLASDTHLPRH